MSLEPLTFKPKYNFGLTLTFKPSLTVSFTDKTVVFMVIILQFSIDSGGVDDYDGIIMIIIMDMWYRPSIISLC